MVESQSRYSIVERLTDRKLGIMEERSTLKEDVKLKEQEVEKLRKELLNWDKDVLEDIKRKRRNREIDIEKAAIDFENAKGQTVEKEKIIDDQLKAVDEALRSIEEISKTAVVNS